MFNPELISEIWNRIVESNTFNFIIFVAILAFIFKKIDVASIITSLQQKIIKIIETAKKERADAEDELRKAEKSVENLGQELKIIMDDAQKSAETIEKKIFIEAQSQIENIEANAKKIIAAEEKLLISNLTKATAKASIEKAKQNITGVLESTPSLHEKYIDQSIDELDRLNF